MKLYIFLFIIVTGLVSCKKDKNNFQATPYLLEIPSHFPEMLIPQDNPMTAEGVELGRFLFYEKRLSGDNTMNCATCHVPNGAFSDPNVYSTGIDGIEGTRHSMALVNLGWEDFFLLGWASIKFRKTNFRTCAKSH